MTTTTTGRWADTHQPVVVAVDGSARNRSAVDWAATYAVDGGCELELVTAVDTRGVPAQPFAIRSQHQYAQDMLADARRTVSQTISEQEVRTEAVEGSPVDVLLEHSRHARLVVVGKRGLSSFARVLVGSTSIALSGRSTIPVAIVPDGWHQDAHGLSPVVLGVDPYRPQHTPIHLAFSRADRLEVPLVVVHGWEPPTVYSWEGAAVTGAMVELEEEANAEFDKILDTWSNRFPAVDVKAVHAHTHPAMAVLAEAEHAQLVVLGRNSHGAFGGFAFGSVTRAVLHYSDCPVLVVPPDPV